MTQLGPSFKFGALLFVLAFVVSAAALYGGAQLVDEEKPASAAADGGGSGVPGGPVTVTIVAKNLTFNPRQIIASPNAPVTATLDNQDSGVLHNLAFYPGRTASGGPIAATETFQGPGTRQVSFKAPAAPGNYAFRCDVHPDTMNGTLTVR